MVLFLLSSVPDVGPTVVEVNDKLVHLTLYAVFGVTLAYGRARSPSPPAHWIVLLAGVAYAATDEWHQAFVPGRDPSLADWAADIIGIHLGYALTRLVRARADGRPEPMNEPET